MFSIKSELWDEVCSWSDGSDHDGDLEYAVSHGFKDIAVYLWDSSGASSLNYSKRPVTDTKFRQECLQFNSVIDRFDCLKCNHQGIYTKGEYVSINWCMSCGDTTTKYPKKD